MPKRMTSWHKLSLLASHRRQGKDLCTLPVPDAYAPSRQPRFKNLRLDWKLGSYFPYSIEGKSPSAFPAGLGLETCIGLLTGQLCTVADGPSGDMFLWLRIPDPTQATR